VFSLGNELLELVLAFTFILSASIMFLCFAYAALRTSRRGEHGQAPWRMPQYPLSPGSMVNPPVNTGVQRSTQQTQAPHNPPHTQLDKTLVNSPVNQESSLVHQIQAPSRTITLEIEFPELPPRLKIPLEKLPKILELLGEETTHETLHHKIVVQEQSREEARGEKRSWSAGKYFDKPWLDILSRVSGLEFSGDGEKVYCPRHGWVPYIVASDWRILCGEGHEVLWDPNKERYRPPDKRELLRMQKELMSIRKEIEDLQRTAEMRPPEAPRRRPIEEEAEEEA